MLAVPPDAPRRVRRVLGLALGLALTLPHPFAPAPSALAEQGPPPAVVDTPFGQERAPREPPESGSPRGDCRALAISGSGTVWVAGERGVLRRVRGGWRPVEPLAEASIEALCGGSGAFVSLVDASAIWRAHERGEEVELERRAPRPQGDVVALRAAGDATVVVTDGALFHVRDSVAGGRLERDASLERLIDPPSDRREPIRDAAIAADGRIAVATARRLAVLEGAAWRELHPEDATRAWRALDARVVAFDGRGRLWLGLGQGLAVLDGGSWTLFTGAEGLPWSDFTSIALAPDDTVWLGTRKGLVRFDGQSWAYRQGRRWLPSDDVRALSIDATGDAWIATDEGVGRIERVPMTLEDKARLYTEEIDHRHRRTPWGFVLEVTLDRPGDRARWARHDSDNDGLWTAMYGAAECFAYAATGDPAAKRRATAAFEALRFLGEVTQGGSHPAPPGFVARTVLPTEGPDPNEGRAEADRRFRDTRDRLWKVIEPRWPTSADGKWYWKSDTSSDELDGHYFLYAAYHDHVAETGEERARVREVVARLTDHLIDHGFRLVDHDGRPTRWGRFAPEDLNHDPNWWEERGLNSMSILSYLRVAEHVTGDARYGAAARGLLEDHGYAANVMWPKSQIGVASGNQSDDEMAFMGFYDLIRYEKDPRLRAQWTFAFHRYWRLERAERNPLFHFLYAAVARDATWTDAWGTEDLSPRGEWLEDSVDTLRRFPLDLADWRLENSHRLDIALLPAELRPGVRTARGVRRDGKVLPVDERFFTHWNHDPFVLDTGGAGNVLADGATFLLPYWLGRHHGFLRAVGSR